MKNKLIMLFIFTIFIINNLCSAGTQQLGSYIIKENSVFYVPPHNSPQSDWKKLNANPKNFKFAGNIGFDERTLFIEGHQKEDLQGRIGNSIYNADPATLEILDRAYSKDPNMLHSFFFKDKTHVYFGENLLNGADPSTFKILNSGYSNDKNNIYFYGNKIHEKNTEKINNNFKQPQVIGELIATPDKLYLGEKNIKDIDVNSLKLIASFIAKKGDYGKLNSYLVKDKYGLYLITSFEITNIPSKHLDLATFKMVSDNFFTDKNKTYTLSKNKIIPSQTAHEFEHQFVLY